MRKQDTSFVLMLFDTFKLLTGSWSVDEIKKDRRDFPRDLVLTSAVGSVRIFGRGEYKVPRESLPVFLIIVQRKFQDCPKVRYDFLRILRMHI